MHSDITQQFLCRVGNLASAKCKQVRDGKQRHELTSYQHDFTHTKDYETNEYKFRCPQ